MVRIHAGQPDFLGKIEKSAGDCKEIAKVSETLGHKSVKFPVTIRNRAAKVKIFAPRANYPFYRIYWRVNGKSLFTVFKTYSEAKAAAKQKAAELAQGSSLAQLTPAEAAAAVAVRDALQAHYQATGRRFTPIEIVATALQADKILGGKVPLPEAARGYLASTVSVRRADLGKAVEEFIAHRQPLTVPRDGKRPQLSAHYHNTMSGWLRRFASSFPGYAVCDLTKEHVDAFFASLAKKSPKTRNLFRGAVALFIRWAASKDYLAHDHRLLQAAGMKTETADVEEIGFYTPAELRKLLENAPADILPVIALGGLAGIRLFEILRLTWEDVFRVPGHVEITAGKAKTRARRLVEICPSLARWLEPYRGRTGPVYPLSDDTFQAALSELCARVGVPKVRNGLRHSFCTYHFAAYGNELATAQQAGNSPDIIHAHYKGLVTQAEGQKWFAVAPANPGKNVVPLPQTAS